MSVLTNHFVSELTSRKLSLGVVKAMWRVWWSVIVVSGRKVFLHKPWGEAPKIVWWWWGLVERRGLLVGWEGSSEMGRSLEKSKSRQHNHLCKTAKCKCYTPITDYKYSIH